MEITGGRAALPDRPSAIGAPRSARTDHDDRSHRKSVLWPTFVGNGIQVFKSTPFLSFQRTLLRWFTLVHTDKRSQFHRSHLLSLPSIVAPVERGTKHITYTLTNLVVKIRFSSENSLLNSEK